MEIIVTGIHVDITDALRNYVHEKFNRLEGHFSHITTAHVTLTVENKIHHRAEAHLHVTKGEVHAHADEKDMYAAIDILVDKLDRQIIKHKELLEKRSHGH